MENQAVKQVTILWADDDPDDILIVREVLQEFGSNYNIIEACNGCKVLEYLEQIKQSSTFPCLIVLDLNMPVVNGKETLVRIKQSPAYKNIPTVVFTTSSSRLDKQFCESYGTEMITKPTTFAALKQVMEKLLHLCEASKNKQLY